MKKVCPNCGKHSIARSSVFFSYLRFGQMVVCPNCSLGAFLKGEINLPYLGLVKEIFIELFAAVITVTLLFNGYGTWETIAAFLTIHILWSWVKSGWEFEGGVADGPNK